MRGGFCKAYKSLSARLSLLEGLYEVVAASRLGFPVHRDSMASFLAGGCDLLLLCRIIETLREAMEGKTVCLYGPRAERPLSGCDVHAGPEPAVILGLEWGIRLLYVTGDGDVSPRALHASYAASHVFLYHLHGDNMHLSPPAHPRIVYTSQTPTPNDCVLGPLGFSDGDRAAIIAMALMAGRIVMEGFGGEPVALHKDYGGNRYLEAKRLKMEVSELILREASARLGYSHLSRGSRALRKELVPA